MINVVWLATYTLAVSFAYAVAALLFPDLAESLLFVIVPAIVLPEAFCEVRGYIKRSRARAQNSQREIGQQ
jgi:hypothetical protein